MAGKKVLRLSAQSSLRGSMQRCLAGAPFCHTFPPCSRNAQLPFLDPGSNFVSYTFEHFSTVLIKPTRHMVIVVCRHITRELNTFRPNMDELFHPRSRYRQMTHSEIESQGWHACESMQQDCAMN